MAECTSEVISHSDAKLTVEGSVENLGRSAARTQYEPVYVKSDEIGMRFLQKAEGKRRARPTFSACENFLP